MSTKSLANAISAAMRAARKLEGAKEEMEAAHDLIKSVQQVFHDQTDIDSAALWASTADIICDALANLATALSNISS